MAYAPTRRERNASIEPEVGSVAYFSNTQGSHFEQININNIQVARQSMLPVRSGILAGPPSLDPILDASHTRNRKTSPPCSACFPGTRIEVVREIVNWAMTGLPFGAPPLTYLVQLLPFLPSFMLPPYSDQHILWVFGYAGCGKSAVAQAVATRLEEERCLGASFFFFRNLGDRSRMSKFAETIASQISTSIDGTARHIQAALIAHPGLLRSTTSPIIQFKHLVYDPIVAVSATRYRPMGIWRPYTILIDGFDECEDREGASEWIKDLILFFERNPRLPLRFIFMSRVEDHIHMRLYNASQVCLLNLVDRTSEEDILTALDAVIAEAKDSRVLFSIGDAWLSPEDKRELIRHIGGSFIFLTTIAKFLFAPSSTDGRTPPERLPLALNMNPGFDSLYSGILESAQHFSHFLDIARTLAVMRRPLSAVEIADLLVIDVGKVVNVLVELHAIIQVPDDDHTLVTLWHSSLQEFLKDERRSGPYAASPEHHERIACRCIELAMPFTAPSAHTPAASYGREYVWDHYRPAIHAFPERSGINIAEELFIRMQEKETFLAEAPADVMDTLYTMAFTRCQPQTQYFFDVISVFTLAFEPISIAQIADLLEIGPAEVAEVFATLHPIFQAEGTYDKSVVPTYPSLCDFLESPGRSGIFFVPLKHHKRLMLRCTDLVTQTSPSGNCPASTYAGQYVWDHYHATLNGCTVEEKRDLHSEVLDCVQGRRAFFTLAKPDIIDDLYNSMLSGAGAIVLDIVREIVFFEGRPSISDLVNRLGLEEATILKSLSTLRGIVHLPDDSDTHLPLTLCHSSFRDFIAIKYPLPQNYASGRSGASSMDTRSVWQAADLSDLTRHIQLESPTAVAMGGFSYIYRGTMKDSTGKVKRVAVKVIRADEITHDPAYINTLQRRLRRESRVWFTFKHQNIIPLLGLAQVPALSNVVSGLVFPWCDNGTVLNFVQKYPETQRIPLIKGVASGLHYMHCLNAVHGDIKSANILISDDFRPLLTDSGFSKISYKKVIDVDLGFTLRYTAPEILERPIGNIGTPRTKETDVWAFGMVGAEIIGGQEVFTRDRGLRLLHRVLEGGRPKKTDFVDISQEADAVWPLLEMCWNASPDLRPTMESIVGSLG